MEGFETWYANADNTIFHYNEFTKQDLESAYNAGAVAEREAILKTIESMTVGHSFFSISNVFGQMLSAIRARGEKE